MINFTTDLLWEFFSNPPIYYTLLGLAIGTILVLMKEVWL